MKYLLALVYLSFGAFLFFFLGSRHFSSSTTADNNNDEAALSATTTFKEVKFNYDTGAGGFDHFERHFDSEYYYSHFARNAISEEHEERRKQLKENHHLLDDERIVLYNVYVS